ncbi:MULTISPECIES: type II secretion system F family protein [unclassified Synechococcus]|uniref:type II secretion system F family protein n=1 Tax=Synechococcales TaxID=1890424 RepID=UPI0021082DE4|nr:MULTISPECIES: type II secretion system F family protein [unclassified Synechococcus]
MPAFLATYTSTQGDQRELRVEASDLPTARRNLRRKGILAQSLVPAGDGPTPIFSATYANQRGQQKVIQLAAPDLASAKRDLRRRGIAATAVMPIASTRSVQASGNKNSAGLFSMDLGSLFEARPNVRDKALFASKLSALVNSGVPIVRGLTLVAKQQKKPMFRRALDAVASDVSQGVSLGVAMRRWPKVFDRITIAMIEAGELGGVLDETLKRLALLLEQNAKLQNQIKGALAYPIIVLVIAVAVFLGMTIFLIPTFADIFEQLGAELPAFTQMMVNLSALLRSVFSLFLIAFLILAGWLFAGFYKTPVGRRRVDGFILKTPLFGDLIQKTETAQFCRTFSSLSKAGVPILMSLEIVRDTSRNSIFADTIEDCRVEIQDGIPVSVALSRRNVFPEMALSMLAIGEETGEMDAMLSKVADFYEDEVEMAVKSLTSLLEPVMIVLVGIIVGSILVAMYLPMFTVFDKIR